MPLSKDSDISVSEILISQFLHDNFFKEFQGLKTTQMLRWTTLSLPVFILGPIECVLDVKVKRITGITVESKT